MVVVGCVGFNGTRARTDQRAPNIRLKEKQKMKPFQPGINTYKDNRGMHKQEQKLKY